MIKILFIQGSRCLPVSWYIGTGHEKEHLKEKEEGDKAELIQRAKELKGEGKTQREIAEEMGISLGAVNKYLKTE